jgi:site-specific DNA-methyltransferase (adenine-specific)
VNQLHFGDNLDVLRDHVADGSIDLIYLDPPFNSDVNYNVLFSDGPPASDDAQAEAFRDTWRWGPVAELAYDEVRKEGGELFEALSGFRRWLGDNGLMAYLSMMAVRLSELRLKLKPTGSMFLHCDPTASHYLKILLDGCFGHRCFQNEVIWSYRRWPTKANRFQRMHDDILFYSLEPSKAYFHTLYQEPTASSQRRWKGKKQLATFDFDGRRNPGLELEEDSQGVPLNDVWPISILAPVSKERLGYPTQKPVALLARIIEAACPDGGTILDPFCGCGTTIEAAEKLHRSWVGIDVTHYAVTLIERRLGQRHPDAVYQVRGRPVDMAGARHLAKKDAHQFQWWAAWLLGAQRYKEEKKGPDKGIDGRAYYKNGPYGDGLIIMSVKSGGTADIQWIRELGHVINRDNAEMGILITLAEPTSRMQAEAAAAGYVQRSAHGRLPRLQIITVEDLLAGKRPILPPLPVVEDITRAGRALKVASKPEETKQLEMFLPISGNAAAKLAEKGEFVDPRLIAMN